MLIQFLNQWLDWVEAGAPKHPIFKRKWGLCTNAEEYDENAVRELTDTLEDEFGYTGSVWPFGGCDRYQEDRINCVQHENPLRLDWVRNKLLDQFLREYLEWATNDAPPHPILTPYCGLCTNAYNYRRSLRDVLHDRLVNDFGPDHAKYPFGGQHLYFDEMHKDSHHRNPARLEWIRSQIK